MKILHLIDVPWDSGLAHYALVLGQGQKEKGNDVYISALAGEKPWKKAKLMGLETVPYVKLANLRALRRFIKEKGLDVLNAHTGSTHTLAVAAAWGQSVAVVRTRSDSRPLRARPGTSLLYRRTQCVIGAAEYIRDAFVKVFNLPPKKAITVYQGITADGAIKPPAAKSAVVGIVARLDPVKGHRYLIEAISLLHTTYRQIRLRIAGQEENLKVRDLRGIAERLHIDNRVEFVGFQGDVEGFMNDCAIGVVASTGSEAVSRVALEWMARGKPVVATRVGCLPEIVREGVTGHLVEPNDAPALASAIGRLLHDPQKAHAMGLAGHSRVKRHFSMDRFITQTLDAYRQAKAQI